MRRLLAIAAAAAVLAALALAMQSGGDDRYLVRAIFDNAGFLVPGEDVRIAGATVGRIDEVDVARPGEQIGGGREATGRQAVVVMEISDPGFQDFRADASCLIRPQSLLGERYVECLPTRPVADGAELAPPLSEVPESETGSGQLLLPLAQNGKAVDLDLVTNVMREPEVDRFRLILNELGAGLAARGPELDAVIRRANPALGELDRTLRVLALERRELATLASDAEAVLGPLARERDSVSRFVDAAGRTADVAAVRREALEGGIAELPGALRELRRTSSALSGLAAEGTPLAADLSTAAPALASALERTPDASRSAAVALESLGSGLSNAAPDLRAADGVIRDLGSLARKTAPGAGALRELLDSLRAAGGYEYLFDLIYNGSGAFNGYDEYGHFLRAELLVTNCVDYVTKPLSGCGSNFSGPAAAAGVGQSSRATARQLMDFLVDPPEQNR